MTIGAWVLVVFVAIAGLFFAAFLILNAVDLQSGVLAAFGGLCIVCTIFTCWGIFWWYANSESGKRALKEQQSDLNGGLERTVTLYSYDGDEIKSWTGKFDVSSSESETYFDIDGKRVIIHGGIVVNEEAE